jgi:FkbM family methyltransferase
MPYSAFIRCLPADFRLVLADAGSAGGLHKRWRAARPVVSAMLFEPRDGGAPRQEGRDRVYPVALGEKAGRGTLHVTAFANMSSMRKPDTTLFQGFYLKGERAEVTGTHDLPVDTLDAVAARDGIAIDAIKIDTQGSELDILRGARQALARSVICVEAEVSFLQRYTGQPLGAEVIAFMAGEGFELIDLSRLKRYRRINSAGIANIGLGGGQRAGRISHCDTFFMRGERHLLERMRERPAEAEGLALKAILLLLIYGKPDMAAALFDASHGMIDSARAVSIGAHFRILKRRWISNGWIHKVFDHLARRT